MKSPLGLEAKLPVFDLFKDAVFLLWAKRAKLVPMFLPIVVLLVVMDHFSQAMLNEFVGSVESTGEELKSLPEGGGRILFMSLVSGFISILLATTVHRFSLQDASQWPSNALRLPKSSDWAYFGRVLLLILISAGAGILTMVPAVAIVQTFFQVPAEQAGVLAMIPVIMVLLYVNGRLSVTLPEIAIGTKGSSLSRAWRMSEGNGFRLVIVALFLPMIAGAPFLLLYQVGNVITDIIASFGVYSITLVSITVLSLSYQFLIDFYEPEDGESVKPETTTSSDDSLDA